MSRATPFVAILVAVSAVAASAQTKLELRATEGQARYATSVTVRQTLSILGQDTKTAVDSQTVTLHNTGKPAADGVVRVDETTESMKMKLELPGGLVLDLDTEKPAGKQDNQMLQDIADGLRRLKGSTISYVHKGGKVTAVEGVDKILAGATPEQLAIISDQLDPKRLLEAQNRDLNRIPADPVKMGDRWKRAETHAFGGGQLMEFQTWYTYQGTVERNGKTLDKIGIFIESATYTLTENATIPLKLVNSDLKVDSSSGTLLLDRSTGRFLEESMSLHIIGPITFSLNGMELPSSLDLTMTIGTQQQ